MERCGEGYYSSEVEGLEPGTRYGFRLDGGPILPDPASRSQPDGVDGTSALVAPDRFRWTDQRWRGIARPCLLFYELHVGTFSRAGTFRGVEAGLDRLCELGVSAVELMPVAQFSGTRNWGYDGVYPFAVQHSYGGLSGLQRLSDACHARGLALFLDVVYNHVGPEGNYLHRFGPYFTDRYRTPWGAALNFDGAGSDEVRRFFHESATWLAQAAHLDGFRVDAVHAIVDPTAEPFLETLTRRLHEVGRRRGWPFWIVAESALNDPRVVRGEEAAGLGFDASWNDDFHHALHVALTGEQAGYYADYDGVSDLRRALVDVFVLDGRYSRFRGRTHGRPAHALPADRFVVFSQNHDHIGNRPFGERLGALVPFEAEKLAAGITLLAPFLPLLFMGGEYGEQAPFQYFTDHRGRALARAVRRGRRREFREAAGGRDPPDPQALATFRRSRLRPHTRRGREARALYALHRALIGLRRAYVPVQRLGPEDVGTTPEDSRVLWIHRRHRAGQPASLGVFRFADAGGSASVPAVGRALELKVESSGSRWSGPGGSAPARIGPQAEAEVPLAPWSFAFYGERTA